MPEFERPLRHFTQSNVDYMYGKVRDLLSTKVMDAEILRQQMNDEPLNKILGKFASEGTQVRLEKVLRQAEVAGMDVSKHQETIDLGMAGFFRIGHVHENSMAARTDGYDKTSHLLQARGWHQRHSMPISVWRTTDSIHKSIHGGAMNWRGETGQDLINTERIGGNVAQILPTVDRLSKELSREEQVIYQDPNWLNDEVKKKTIAGLWSADALVHAQGAKALRNFQYMGLALSLMKDSHDIEHNAHRLATISIWTMAAAFTYRANDSRINLFDRSKMAFEGFKSFAGILFSKHRKDAISALKQAIKRKI